ncbi:MAG: capsular biosynthesis protein, partial [Pseudomonadota bacterium]
MTDDPSSRLEAAARVVLFLQGPSSPFFVKLAKSLTLSGANVIRVTLCPGDRLYWSTRHGPAIPFKGRPDTWPGFIMGVIREHKVTDLICLGDGRVAHAEAIAAAHRAERPGRHNNNEQGYNRPHQRTREPHGARGHSRVPEAFVVSKGQTLPTPEPVPRFRSSFVEYAAYDTLYHLTNVLTGWVLYPHYRGHALDPPLREWAGWLGKLLRRPARARARATALREVADHAGPLFLFPLQLLTDYQIRTHGTDGGLR